MVSVLWPRNMRLAALSSRALENTGGPGTAYPPEGHVAPRCFGRTETAGGRCCFMGIGLILISRADSALKGYSCRKIVLCREKRRPGARRQAGADRPVRSGRNVHRGETAAGKKERFYYFFLYCSLPAAAIAMARPGSGRRIRPLIESAKRMRASGNVSSTSRTWTWSSSSASWLNCSTALVLTPGERFRIQVARRNHFPLKEARGLHLSSADERGAHPSEGLRVQQGASSRWKARRAGYKAGASRPREPGPSPESRPPERSAADFIAAAVSQASGRFSAVLPVGREPARLSFPHRQNPPT